ncbi:PoNe immunity protein domain-containing protein [Paracidovorax oryzae]|uniref:PoNe immunity protein domain-containing protein n=1 Tax=Paracidovorax oryzae TaxID=862720 RepID=UPI0035D05787
MSSRDKNKDAAYFDELAEFYQGVIDRDMARVESFDRPEGRFGMAHNLSKKSLELCIIKYGRGDEISSITPSVWQWVKAQEIHARVMAAASPEHRKIKEMYEKITLDTVYNALTILAFAKALKFQSGELKRVINAIGHAGEDALIDEAARGLGDAGRSVAGACLYPKVYDPLLEVWRCDPSERSAKLLAFAKVWKKKIKPIYWSDSLNEAEGAYFGYWCFDIALTGIVLGIPDEALRDNPHYPKDLVDAARSK